MTKRLNLIILVGIAGVFLLVVPLFVGSYWLHILILMFLNMALVAGYRLLYETGLASFAHCTFYAIGGYTSALLAIKLGLPFGICFLAAGIVPALGAVFIGRLAVRLEDIYFFLVSFALFAVVDVVLKHWVSFTGGFDGISGIPPIMGLQGEIPYYYIIMTFIAVTMFILYRLDRSRFGAELLAIGAADNLAEAVGINVVRHRTLAFAIGALFAGFAGSLYAHYAGYINPTGFSFWLTVYILIWCAVGGYRKFWGPVAAAAVLTLVCESLRVTGTMQAVLYGVVIVIVITVMPHGIAGLVDTLRERRVKAPILGWLGSFFKGD